MRFKGTEIGFNDFNNANKKNKYDVSWRFNDYTSNYYYSSDIIYFANILYNSIQSVPNGTQSAHIWEFGDLFNYYEYNESTGTYDKKVDLDKAKTIIANTKSYYSILVNKSANGLTKSTDSIFNCYKGTSGFNVTNDYVVDDYFVGRSIIKANLNDFDKVALNEQGDIALKLKTNFVNYYKNYADKIVVDVLLDLDLLENEVFVGFTKDSGLNNFEISSCQSVQTIDGTRVFKVVDYV